ncbi:hypothetical protein G8S49_01350 [Clostridium botulinum C]|uniref:Uncharacterized protein n=1 Tax=Clostridium botulinum C TaxID=36828 RepID=A0A9Q3V8S4_CLOBO|nr:hypothetical protein [Clostridium botulinum]MCD3194222.1 hypothetical protein [Clostridium botulinum C]MCD3199149.1 hypothetical protein [Clostridium botulinum C]MCD3204624.1 hypothetical protein [Clostridium botulinum C]MCD3207967.1 hypothetical protein [Clostridium botulinum C]MCD3225093.1 hypothetical protein [Clostridium botulinum C]
MDTEFWTDEVVRLYREGYAAKKAITIVKERRLDYLEKNMDKKRGTILTRQFK